MQLTIQVNEELAKIIIKAGDLAKKRGSSVIEPKDFFNTEIKVVTSQETKPAPSASKVEVAKPSSQILKHEPAPAKK